MPNCFFVAFMSAESHQHGTTVETHCVEEQPAKVFVKILKLTKRRQRNQKTKANAVLKTLNADKAQLTPYLQMLRKELEVLMQMQHQGVVQALGLEQVEGIGSCIILEFIDGETLEQLLEHGAPTLPQRREIARQLCEALAYVHSMGIVHRELKPANIMVTRNGHYVKLIDFGMADTYQHAVLKQPAGTLSYMSQEQASQAVPDIRNDIYSLGLIMQKLELGKMLKPVIDRCLKPIEQRYASIAELQADVADRQKRRQQWKKAAVMMASTVVIALMGWWAWQHFPSQSDHLKEQSAAIDLLQQQLQKQRAENDEQLRRNQDAQMAMQRQMSESMAMLSDSIRHLTTANAAMQEELTRTDRAKTAALQALHKEIGRSQVDRHLDTLSEWEFRWPDLSKRMTDVSRFIYNYVDRLADGGQGLQQHERDQVRQAILDEWKQWSTKVVTRANGIRLRLDSSRPDSMIYVNREPTKPL